jgi:hypothetical protein
MGVIVSGPNSKIAYYRMEADKLRRRAAQVQRETGDAVEAARLMDLAKQADDQALSIQTELNELASKP